MGQAVVLYDFNDNELSFSTGLNGDPSLPVNLSNIDVQNPLPVDGDQTYPKDVSLEESDIGSFTGDILHLLGADNFATTLTATGATNPKYLELRFKRPLLASLLGFGTLSGDFSNSKVIIKTFDGTEILLLDDSGDSTKLTQQNVKFQPVPISSLRLEFYTTDTISLNGVLAAKDHNVVSRIQALQPDLTVVDIGATPSGNLKTSDAENGLAIAKGEVSGSTFIHKFGKAPDFDSGDNFVTIWDGADDGGLTAYLYTYSTSAIIDSLSSSNTGDTQDIEVQGLDADYELVIQTITLTGQTRKALTTDLIRVFRLKNVGSTTLAGDVYCFEDTTLSLGVPVLVTKVRAQIHIGNNQTLMSIFTVPAGRTGYMRDWYASAAGARKTSVHEIKLFARPFGQVFQLKHDASIALNGSSYIHHQYVEPEVFTEKTDIEMQCNSDEDIASISGGFDIVLVDN